MKFRTHPDFDQIKFIVHPHLRELLDTVAEIPVDLDEFKTEFGEMFPNLDLSLITTPALFPNLKEEYQPKLYFGYFGTRYFRGKIKKGTHDQIYDFDFRSNHRRELHK